MNPFDATPQTPALEAQTRELWQNLGVFSCQASSSPQHYTVVIPPPNVTGDLTMGHVLNNTLQDVLVRWHRALGRPTCWIPGTDHASIATEAKVTRMLKDKGVDKQSLGREGFLKEAWQWKNTYGGRIVECLKLLGASCDWSREVFTMDPRYSQAVTQAFVTLYKEGLVYKSHRLVNWCPVSQSVISDEEVMPQETQGHMWHIKYAVLDDQGKPTEDSVVVATTRPETLFGDLAVAVHPQDPRFAHLIGKKVLVPVANRAVPLIGDTYVDKDFGTGALKITPAHDMNDFEVGQRHKLGLLNVMNPDATLNSEVPEGYRGLDRYAARKKLVAALKDSGALDKVVPHTLVVGISERGGVPIEYYLSEQWYFRMEGFAKKALEATRSGQLTFVPAYQEKIWEHWLTNIKDWCVSRQLWWGHPIPVYTCPSCGHVHCEVEQPTTCHSCGHNGLVADGNVLDTWASSWLWPFAVQGWPAKTLEEEANLRAFYPTEVIVTGADIIFFWVARMVMAGLHFTGKLPFRHVYFTPIIRDAQGRKMSKSLGNSPNVLDLMKTYGTDALRFSVLHQVVAGQDIHWADGSCDLGRNFVNKLWNVARFLFMNCEKLQLKPWENTWERFVETPQESMSPLGPWLRSEFLSTVGAAHEALAQYEFSRFSATLYEFSWKIFCDWYVEMAKPYFQGDKEWAARVLAEGLSVFDGLLRLLHPVMPYITEHIWQLLGPEEGNHSRQNRSIGLESLPLPGAHLVDTQALEAMRVVQEMVGAIRAIRGQFTLHPGVVVPVEVIGDSGPLMAFAPQMEALAKAQVSFNGPVPHFSAPALVGERKLYVNLEGLVDPKAELERIVKKIAAVEKAMATCLAKINNPTFVANAPAHIVAGAKSQLDSNEKELAVLKEQQRVLASI